MSQKINRYLNPHEIHRPQLPTLRERKQMRKSGIPLIALSSINQPKSIVRQFVNQQKTTSQSITTTTRKYGLRNPPERSEHYNSGYVIGGPLFVIGTVAEFASKNPQELLYVSEDGSIRGFEQPLFDDDEQQFQLMTQNNTLMWSNDVLATRDGSSKRRNFSSSITQDSSDVYLETQSNQCVRGSDPALLRFWNQIHPSQSSDESDVAMLVGGAFLQIKKAGIYEIDIHLTIREQFSTVGKRCLLLNLIPGADDDNDVDETTTLEQSIILLEQQPPSDIESDHVMVVLKVCSLEENDTISLSLQISDGDEEDSSCVLPNSLWVIRLIAETDPSSRVCSLSSNN